MARKIAVNELNASTIDILNVIRANANAEYQSMVPEVTKETDIPKVGEIIYGYPALANQFVNALVNRIAAVRVKSATFNNRFAPLKKGYLEFGETVEEVFVNIAKVREFSVEKAAAREMARTLPDVRAAFHAINWRVQYPVTIQDQDLKQAFLSLSGVQDMIARIVDAIYTAAEYDEYLLFKYLLIKAVSHGKMYPVAVDTTDFKNTAIAFRGASNALEFLSTKYNASGVHTATRRNDQYIFMSADFNAKFDVDILAGAFNMDKTDFLGHLQLVDNWDEFDNARFVEIVENSDCIEPVTEAELALMKDAQAILVDQEWFQVYDNNNKFTEDYIGAGMYWNYFYNVWKTISSSPFSNAVVFVKQGDTAAVEPPAEFTAEIASKSIGEGGTVLTLVAQDDNPAFTPSNVSFVQDEAAVKAGVAVHPYGAYILPPNAEAIAPMATVMGVMYKGGATLDPAAEVGSTITFTKAADAAVDDAETASYSATPAKSRAK